MATHTHREVNHFPDSKENGSRLILKALSGMSQELSPAKKKATDDFSKLQLGAGNVGLWSRTRNVYVIRTFLQSTEQGQTS